MTSTLDNKPADPAEQTHFDGSNGNRVVLANSGSGMSLALGEMNKQYPDGKTGGPDAGASSGDFLRQAAFARESLQLASLPKPQNAKQ